MTLAEQCISLKTRRKTEFKHNHLWLSKLHNYDGNLHKYTKTPFSKLKRYDKIKEYKGRYVKRKRLGRRFKVVFLDNTANGINMLARLVRHRKLH